MIFKSIQILTQSSIQPMFFFWEFFDVFINSKNAKNEGRKKRNHLFSAVCHTLIQHVDLKIPHVDTWSYHWSICGRALVNMSGWKRLTCVKFGCELCRTSCTVLFVSLRVDLFPRLFLTLLFVSNSISNGCNLPFTSLHQL